MKKVQFLQNAPRTCQSSNSDRIGFYTMFLFEVLTLCFYDRKATNNCAFSGLFSFEEVIFLMLSLMLCLFSNQEGSLCNLSCWKKTWLYIYIDYIWTPMLKRFPIHNLTFDNAAKT